MNSGMLEEVIEEQIQICRDILIEKSREYTPGSDRLSNFRQAASAQCLTMEQALAGMMAKHTISIFDMIWSPEEYPMEKWEEKITDHLNYLLLLKAILVEKQLDNAEEKADQTLKQAGAAMATAAGNIPKMDISPGDYVEEFGTLENTKPVAPQGPDLEHARKMMPHFFGPIGGDLGRVED